MASRLKMRYKARQMRKLKEQLINAMHCPTKYSRKHQKLSGGTPPATLARKNFTATTRSQLALIMTNLAKGPDDLEEASPAFCAEEAFLDLYRSLKKLPTSRHEHTIEIEDTIIVASMSGSSTFEKIDMPMRERGGGCVKWNGPTRFMGLANVLGGRVRKKPK
mmetsp:Transcript_23389/g.48591  ORF Transcript_23389/g.48591 Transcript_23389/m.48591 type:complete len:163 (+) Transcript_23389:1041-1529(+)